MNRIILKLAIFIGFLILLNGCSAKILVPYEECAECQTGKGMGYCGSVSDVYEITKKENR